MNYLIEQAVKRQGNVIATYQQGNVLRQVYSYNDKRFIIDSYKPLFKPNFIEKEKGKYIMSKLAMLKAKKAINENKQKTVNLETVKPETKYEMTMQGIQVASEIKLLIAGIKADIENIKADIKADIKQQSERIEKLYQITFNNNNDQIITLLGEMHKRLNETKQVKPEVKQVETVPETSVKLPDNAFKTFQKYFTGNVSEENFNKAFKADFSTIETMEESLKTIEKQNQIEGHGFLCARKSKKNFIAALWQTYQDTKGGETKSKVIDKSNSPVFSLKSFSKNLGIKMETVNEILEYIESLDCFDDDIENELYEIILEENPHLEDEDSIVEFIEFCRNKF